MYHDLSFYRIDDSHFESDPGKRQKYVTIGLVWPKNLKYNELVNRDEKLAANLGLLKRDIDKVITMPMDEFQVN